MKLPLMAAIAALSLYGCSHSANTREASSPEAGAMGGSGSAGSDAAAGSDINGKVNADGTTSSEDQYPGETGNVSELEKRDRQGAPTVYEGEATGGSGAADETVKTKDGQKWDVQQNTPTDLGNSQVAPGSSNQNRNPAEKTDGTGGSGLSADDTGKSEVKDQTGSDASNNMDDTSTDSSVESGATPDPTN